MINQLLEPSQAAAMRLLAAGDLAKSGLGDFDKLDLRSSSDQALKRYARDLAQCAKRCASHVTDDATERDARRASDAADGFLRLIEAVEAELASRTDEERQRKLSLHTGEPGEASSPEQSGYSARRWDGRTEVRALDRGETFAQRIRASGGRDDFRQLRPGALMRAMVTGAKSEAEERALSTAAGSAGVTVPDLVAGAFIDLARPRSRVLEAGAQLVPLAEGGKTTFAKIAADPTAAWRAQNDLANEDDPAFTAVAFEPRSLAVLVKVSNELMQDSVNVEAMLERSMSEAIAQEIDRAALFGSGSAAEPLGVAGYTGATANDFAGGALSNYAPLIQARTALRTANFDCTAYIMSPRDEGALAALATTEGLPIDPPSAIRDIPMLSTSRVPVDGGVGGDESQIFAADWSQLAIGVRQNLQMLASPVPGMDRLQTWIVASIRLDIQPLDERAFTIVDGITPST